MKRNFLFYFGYGMALIVYSAFLFLGRSSDDTLPVLVFSVVLMLFGMEEKK